MGIPVLVALGQKVPQAADARVGHQNIDLAKLLHPRLIAGTDAVHIGHIHADGHSLGSLGAELGGHILHPLAAGGQHHSGAVLDKGAAMPSPMPLRLR